MGKIFPPGYRRQYVSGPYGLSGPFAPKNLTGKNKSQALTYRRPEYRYMTKKRMYVCSVEAAMDVIGGKWKPHILLKIKDAPLRFGAIQAKLPAISQKMLTRQLRALEADLLITRTEYPGMPPRVEYALTERGETVIPLLLSLKDWASEELADQINEHA
jgi:DNA-binding HxlR family transcriptional regulator